MEGRKLFALFLVPALLTAFGCSDRSGTKVEPPKASAFQEDPCLDAFNEMVLVRTWKRENITYGALQIRVATVEKEPIVIKGWKMEDGFHADGHFEIFEEYKDVSGSWNRLESPPGTFMAPPDTLTFTSDQRVEIVAMLPPDELAEKAEAWRIKLRDSAGCRASLPFHVKQKRGPVEGFVSDPAPDYWNKEKNESCDCDEKSKWKP